MATGTLFAPGGQSGGKTDLLRTILNALSGNATAAGSYAGETELLEAIALAMQTWPAPDVSSLALQPTGTVASTHDRTATNFAVTTSAGASGTLNLTAVFIPANTVVNKINCVTGTTGSTGVTHNWAVLADLNLKVLAVSADNTTTDLVASTVQSYTLTSPFTTTYGGLYYAGVMIATGTTQPTWQGTIQTGTTVQNIAPKVAGSSNTGATTPVAVGATLTAVTTTVGNVYFYLT